MHPISLRVPTIPSQSILGWRMGSLGGWAQLYGRATAHWNDASYSTHAPYVLPLATMQPCLAQGLGPDRGQRSSDQLNLTAKNFMGEGNLFACRLHHNFRTFTDCSAWVSLSRSLLSCLLQPRNLEAIKSSLPQFLRQTLHLLYA